MNITPDQQQPSRVIIGIDTHKDVHVAAALDQHGALLGIEHFKASTQGYQDLSRWAHNWQRALGAIELTYGIEGTGSYGAGLLAALRSTEGKILEVGRPNRQDRTGDYAGRPTPTTPRTLPGPSWPVSPPGCPRPPTGRSR